ncbi:MAG: DUF1905 domain-containing protein [Proteobacteria bacterium]|nr:DUF1905 domain-containing protein [Pseudomonadota bacterium]
MHGLTFDFDATTWEWTGKGAWTFVTLPEETAQDIRYFTGPRRGFGSVRVEATLGKSRWKTSVFPDRKRNSYLLPLKAAVRKAEKVRTGDTVKVSLRLIDL